MSQNFVENGNKLQFGAINILLNLERDNSPEL